MRSRVLAASLVFLTPLSAAAQLASPAKPRDAGLPPPRHIHDSRYGVSYDFPAGWNVTERDSDVSTFALDARTAAGNTRMRQVAQLAFNPFPASTFAGALFYFSVTPHATEHSCAGQASAQAPRVPGDADIGGLTFVHGYDEHGAICTEARDEIYTALRRGACLRFDLVLNTFCGGDVSGVRSMSPAEIEAVRKRLEHVLTTVRFDPDGLARATPSPIR